MSKIRTTILLLALAGIFSAAFGESRSVDTQIDKKKIAAASTYPSTIVGQNASHVGMSSTTAADTTTGTRSLRASMSPQTGEQLRWQVISGGGSRSTSTSYILGATVGQAAIGPSSSSGNRINAGFWQVFAGSGCCLAHSADGRTGNIDADPSKGVDISDLTALIDFLYISFGPPVCLETANIDGDASGGVDISDLTGLIDFLYISFTPPAMCR